MLWSQRWCSGARVKDVYVYNFPFFYLKLQLNVVQYGTYNKINFEFDFFFKG